MRKYGTDKPDLRNPIEMQDVSEHFRGSGFKVFARMLEDPKTQVWAIPAPGGGSRAFCDRMNSWAQGEGQPGLGYIMWREGGEGAGPLANNIGPAAIRSLDMEGRMTVCNMSIEAGARAGMIAPGRHHFQLSARPPVRPERRRLGCRRRPLEAAAHR